MPRIAATCGSLDHSLSRRAFLGGLIASAVAGTVQADTHRRGKRLLMIYQAGGLSQLESWDPKPNTATGGPCRTIATSVPGLHIAEWLPHSARVMHRLMTLRGLSTGDNNHGPAHYLMTSGRREGAALVYPHIACVVNKYLTPDDHPVPGCVSLNGFVSPAFLGPRYGPVNVSADKPPAHLELPPDVSKMAEQRRQDARRRFDNLFALQRGSAMTAAYTQSFDQAQQLMRNKRLFDSARLDPKQLDRYGRHDLGRQCLLALQLLEQGVTCVELAHGGYDTHAEHFNMHLDLVQEFDRPFACLIDDLTERGLLDDTVVICLGEFGRTPQINHRMGRDHWSWAWSCVVGGAGFPRGAVYGSTNADGTAVKDGKIEAAPLFHTLLKSLGIRSTQTHTVDGQRVPIADPAFAPIDTLLA
jgi:hypothetical protein